MDNILSSSPPPSPFPSLSLSPPPLSFSLPIQMVSSSECILYHEGVSLNEELLKHTEFFPPHYSLTINDCPMATLPTEPVLVTVSNCVSPAEFTVRIIIIMVLVNTVIHGILLIHTHTPG